MDVENLELHCLTVHKETPEVKPKIKVKTMETVLKCEKCNKSFKRKAYLKKHALNFHKFRQIESCYFILHLIGRKNS